MNSRTLTLALSIAASLVAAPAFAASEPEAHSVAVRYSDLNLTTAAGLEELDRRLDKAAREVCDLGTIATGTRIASAESRSCYRETKKQLEERVAALVEQDRRG